MRVKYYYIKHATKSADVRRIKYLDFIEKKEKIRYTFGKSDALIRWCELVSIGIFSNEVPRFISDGVLEKVKRGLYQIPKDEPPSDEKVIAALFPDGVLCNHSALFYYGYSDRTPSAFEIAIDRNTSKSRFKLDYPFVVPHYMEKHLLTFGVMRVDFGDCTMKIFDRDRLICEVIRREKSMDREIFNKAIQGYVNDSQKNIANLTVYAKQRRMLNRVKERIGVWL